MSTTRRWTVVPSLGLAALMLLVACAPAAQPAAPAAPTKPGEKPAAAAKPAGPPVTISAVTGWFKEYVFNDGLWELQRRLEEKSGGNMKIAWRGGPEVSPAFEQVGPLKSGVYDMVNTSGAYYTQEVPEAVLLDYFDGSVSDLRQNGIIDLFDEINQKRAGIKLLGVSTSRTPYHLFTKRPIASIDDFRGLKIRGTPTYQPLISALGASPVNTPASEIYAAMERGVVDGFAWPRMGIEEQKLYEVTCCIVEPGFWTVRTVMLMNLRSWERLSPDQQKLLLDTVQEIEAWAAEHHGERSTKEIDRLVSNHGMRVIRLPEDQARRYRQFAYEEPWKAFVPNMPEYGPRIQELARQYSKAWPPADYQVTQPY